MIQTSRSHGHGRHWLFLADVDMSIQYTRSAGASLDNTFTCLWLDPTSAVQFLPFGVS
jgi:hypothetical protein